MNKPKYEIQVFELTNLAGPVWRAVIKCNCTERGEHTALETEGNLKILMHAVGRALVKHEEHDKKIEQVSQTNV
jgi:hypothetical protein